MICFLNWPYWGFWIVLIYRQSTMSFSDGKILINNVPADDKGKPNTLTREVAGDKLTQVKNGPGFSILWRLHVKN